MNFIYKISIVVFLSIIIYGCSEKTTGVERYASSIDEFHEELIEETPEYFDERDWLKFPPHTAESNFDKRLKTGGQFFDDNMELNTQEYIYVLKERIINLVDKSDVYINPCQYDIYHLFSKKMTESEKNSFLEEQLWFLEFLVDTKALECYQMVRILNRINHLIPLERRMEIKEYILTTSKYEINKISKRLDENKKASGGNVVFVKMDEGDLQMYENAISMLSVLE